MTQTQNPTAQGGPVLAWSAPTHHNHDRSPRWYLIGGGVVLAVAAYAALTGAWTLTLVSLIIGGLYYLVRQEATPLKAIRLEQDGVQFERSFTPWRQCKEFWLIETPLFTELHILRSAGLRREIRIQTGDIDPIKIRAFLSQNLPMRVDQRERLFDALIRICKL
jgi:hypothetical protein